MKDIKFVDEEDASKTLPDDFEPYVKEWFNSEFSGLSEPQKYAFDLIQEDKNSLICAPTGSGKCVKPNTTLLLQKNGCAMLKDAEEI